METKRRTMEDLRNGRKSDKQGWFANFYSYDTATNEWILSIFYGTDEIIFVKFKSEKPLTIVNFPVSSLIKARFWCGYYVKFTGDQIVVKAYSDRDYYWEGIMKGIFPIVDVWRAHGCPVLGRHKFVEKIK